MLSEQWNFDEEIVRKGCSIDAVQLWVQRKAICKIFIFSSDLNMLWSSAYLIAKTRSSCGCWTIPYQDNIVCIQLSICGAYHWSSPSWSFIPSRSPRCGDIYDFFGYFKRSDIGILLDLLFLYFLDCFSSRLYKILDFQDFCHGPLSRGVSVEKELLFPRHDKVHHLVQFQNSAENGSVNDFSVQERKARYPFPKKWSCTNKSLSPSSPKIGASVFGVWHGFETGLVHGPSSEGELGVWDALFAVTGFGIFFFFNSGRHCLVQLSYYLIRLSLLSSWSLLN